PPTWWRRTRGSPPGDSPATTACATCSRPWPRRRRCGRWTGGAGAQSRAPAYPWPPPRRPPRDDRVRYVLKTLAEAPSLLALDRRDRSDFLRHFYRRYDKAPIAQLDDDSNEMFSHLLLAKSFPAAIRRVREHRAAGHRTLLITGPLDFAIGPLRPLFDDVVCGRVAAPPARCPPAGCAPGWPPGPTGPTGAS